MNLHEHRVQAENHYKTNLNSLINILESVFEGNMVTKSILGRRGGVLARFGSKNQPQHKPDLTWNGKRRSFFLIASCSLRFPKQISWNVLGSQSLLQAPGRSARFARCARSLAALASPW